MYYTFLDACMNESWRGIHRDSSIARHDTQLEIMRRGKKKRKKSLWGFHQKKMHTMLILPLFPLFFSFVLFSEECRAALSVAIAFAPATKGKNRRKGKNERASISALCICLCLLERH